MRVVISIILCAVIFSTMFAGPAKVDGIIALPEDETIQMTRETETEETESIVEESAETEPPDTTVEVTEKAEKTVQNKEPEEKKHAHTEGDYVTVKKATCTEQGSEAQYCTTCNALLDTRTVDALGHKYSGMQTVQEASPTADRIERDTCTLCGKIFEEKRTTINEIISEETACRGNYGRLYISSVGVDVALFYVSDNYQGVVDKSDSAAMFDWNGNNTVIADHYHQGFGAIRNVSIGSIAYIVTPNKTIKLKCIDKISDAVNADYSFQYKDGSIIEEKYNGKYIMYTCNGTSTYTSITVTVWNIFG